MNEVVTLCMDLCFLLPYLYTPRSIFQGLTNPDSFALPAVMRGTGIVLLSQSVRTIPQSTKLPLLLG